MGAKSLSDLKQQERGDRRKLILDTACELFATKDFRQVTGREIAKNAGMSIGTLYNYYRNLDELFLDIFLRSTEDLTQLIDSTGENPLALSLLCEIYITYLNEHMTFYQMMGHFMLGSDLSPDATEKLNQYMRSLIDRLEASVKAAGIPGNTRIISHAIFSAMNGTMISYASYPGRTPDNIRQHTLRLTDIILKAFVCLKK